MKQKTQPVNPVKFLIDEADRSPEWIACQTFCSLTSVLNWRDGKPISRYFKPILMRLMKREESRLAAQVIKDANAN